MNDAGWKLLDKIGDGCLIVTMFGAIFLCIAIMFLSTGCRHCTPKIQTVEVKVPVYSCQEPPQVQPLLLPSFPAPPESGASEQELKEWYAQMESIVQLRETILESRISTLNSLLDQYREPDPQ